MLAKFVLSGFEHRFRGGLHLLCDEGESVGELLIIGFFKKFDLLVVVEFDLLQLGVMVVECFVKSFLVLRF